MTLGPDATHAGMRDASEEGTVRASILGVNAWLVTVLWPLAPDVNRLDVHAIAAACGSFAVLATTLLALRAGRRALGAWFGLCAFPVSAIAIVAWRTSWPGSSAHWLELALQALSLLAFGASVATRAEAAPLLAGRETALDAGGSDVEPARTRRLRVASTALACLGAFALAVLAPTIGAPDIFVRAWGEAARDAAVLTAVVGASVAVAWVAGFSDALRSDHRPAVAPGDRAVRVVAFLALAALGAAAWWAIKPS
jgi:hypothetical protein